MCVFILLQWFRRENGLVIFLIRPNLYRRRSLKANSVLHCGAFHLKSNRWMDSFTRSAILCVVLNLLRNLLINVVWNLKISIFWGHFLCLYVLIHHVGLWGILFVEGKLSLRNTSLLWLSWGHFVSHVIESGFLFNSEVFVYIFD